MLSRNGGVHLFNMLGFRVSADWSWFVIFILMSMSLATGFFPGLFLGESAATYWTVGIVSTALLFFSVLLHEVGHAYMARRLGIRIHGIRLFIFGGVAQLEREPQSPEVELKVAIAGPVVSAVLAAVFHLLSQVPVAAFGTPVVMASYFLARANLMMALFNLLPGFPLDGGRILRAILWKVKRNYYDATEIASSAGKVVAVGFIVLGSMAVVLGAFGNGLWLILIGMFLYQAAQAVYDRTRYDRMWHQLSWRDMFDSDRVLQPSRFSSEQELTSLANMLAEMERLLHEDDFFADRGRRNNRGKYIRIYF